VEYPDIERGCLRQNECVFLPLLRVAGTKYKSSMSPSRPPCSVLFARVITK
jgi:hypothetical protein